MSAATEKRKQSIDLMRIVAAFGIVWAHMGAPFAIEGYVALGLFVVLMAFLSWRSAQSRPGPSAMTRRMAVLAVPWILWSAFYLGLDALRAGDMARLWTVTDWRSLLIGPVIHLWYLPFAVLAVPLATLAARALSGPGAVWAAALILAPLAALAVRVHDTGIAPEPFVQWAFATTPLAYGLLSAAAHSNRAWPAPLVFLVLGCLPPWLLWGSLVAPNLIAAALLFEAFWRMHLTLPGLPALGRLAFGVYLVHPFVMLVWYHFVPATSPPALGAIAVFAGSLVLAALIRRLPLLRRIA